MGLFGCYFNTEMENWTPGERSDLLARFFNNKFKVFGMGLVLFAGEFYVNDLAIDSYRCICYKILTSEFCRDLRAVLGTI